MSFNIKLLYTSLAAQKYIKMLLHVILEISPSIYVLQLLFHTCATILC